MATLVELIRQGRYDEVWRQYCGFLDLSLEEFMKIQERLLLEQLDLVSRSEWGRLFLRGPRASQHRGVPARGPADQL